MSFPGIVAYLLCSIDIKVMDFFPIDQPVFFLKTGIILSLGWLFFHVKTKDLIRTKKLLNEKEQTLIQNKLQSLELEKKNKNITDSINYAQRIQEALLPSEEYFRKFFEKSFILYMPKDILSGDFYWIGENDQKLFVAAADCTGHGVPGALLSMMGHDMLDQAVMVDNLKHPSEILGLMSKGIENAFCSGKNIGAPVRDGIDLGICVIDKKARKIEFSGAMFSLYIIRDNTLTDIKGDRYTLGMVPQGKGFTNKIIDLMDDDVFYLFSDGYVDQFGGAENKKFKYKKFRYLLNTIHHFSFDEQKSILEESIKTWMGRNPQSDDILVIGFKPLSR